MRHRARGPQKGQPSLVCKNERWINGAHKSRHAAYVAFRAGQKGRAVVMSNQVYDRSFVARVQKMATQSASVLVEIVMKLFNPRSVVDIGCGTGSWLRGFSQHGVDRILGFDGSWVPRDKLLIPAESFVSIDLSKNVPEVSGFDLAISLEVRSTFLKRWPINS